MRIEAGAETDVGKVRERNEDGYLVEPPLYAVADGMGGHRGGAVASQLALESLGSTFRAHGDPLGRQVRDANDAVFERSIEDQAVAGMGTTLTAIQIDGDQAILAHVGDSRAYLLRAGDLRQLTEDHTLVNRMVKAGELTPQEAEVHPHRNVLVRSLGTEPSVKVDELSVGIADGDRLLVCSDGLTGMVTEEQIKAILESTPGPDEAAHRLIRAANRAGGIDNITVIVLDVHDDDGAGRGWRGRLVRVGAGGVHRGGRAHPPALGHAGRRHGPGGPGPPGGPARLAGPAVVRGCRRGPRRGVPGDPRAGARIPTPPRRRGHGASGRERGAPRVLRSPVRRHHRGGPQGRRPHRHADADDLAAFAKGSTAGTGG